jgi:hypothetical protein
METITETQILTLETGYILIINHKKYEGWTTEKYFKDRTDLQNYLIENIGSLVE